jgi:FixJ family two-component response regulator
MQREREVRKLVAEAKAAKYVAEFLDLSAKTVGIHRSGLIHKPAFPRYAKSMRL